MRTAHLLAALATALVASPASSQSADGTGVMYRCPGNDYNNTITASEAEKLRCKKVENAAVTVIQSAHPAASAASGPAAESGAPVPARAPGPTVTETMTPAESAALRTRASNARRSLETRLKSEEGRLSALEKEFNGGEPERRMDEFDFQKYLDRVATMRSAIARKQIDIAELRREIDKLPTR
jgi:hypothetical protein